VDEYQSITSPGPSSSTTKPPGGTDIPTFCAACPQPGVNLPENWTEDPDQFVHSFISKVRYIILLRMAYTRTFVMDGNFTAVHQKRENAQRDVKLSHGEFFMTEPTRYKSHLAVVKEVKEVRYLYFDFSSPLTSQ
jgi:hypothetical protein